MNSWSLSNSLKTPEQVKKEMNQVLLSSIVELPTGNGDPEINNWKIATSVLSCGLLEFQGWSSGHNLQSTENNAKFEERMFLMTYFCSIRLHYFNGPQWHRKVLQGQSVANIGVQREIKQFFVPKQNYLTSSEDYWMTRLAKFINDFDLGEFRRTPEFLNPNYQQHKIQVGVWTFNGNHPPLSAFPQFKKVT